ncbi:MAG TPA: glycoside hydrolase family 88 protein [Bacteroidota bacterium]|nr:glycoside hydrolase family 88 protein [Bacteroidota bacterium]
MADKINNAFRIVISSWFRWRNVSSIAIALFSILCLLPVILASQEIPSPTQKLQLVANGIVDSSGFQFADRKSGQHFPSTQAAPSDADLRIVNSANDWRYWNGVLNIGMIALGGALHDSSYIEFAKKNIAFCFDNCDYFRKRYKGEDKWSYPFGQFIVMEDLDDVGAMGASLIEVYEKDRQLRYREIIDKIAGYIQSKQNRLDDGTIVRAYPYKWTIWADDLFMSVSFLSRLGELTGDVRYFDDAARQVVNFHKRLFDDTKGLMTHCWYSDVNRRGVAFWGRANGWAMMAQVDLLDRLPRNHPMRDTLIALLQRQIVGIARYQGPEGLWHQLLDKEDSFLETSCSAMFTYTIARAVNHGYCDRRYASIARRGWEGIESKIRPDGKIEGVCAGTVVSDNLVDYYRRPTPLNDPHGTGAMLLAGVEVLQLPK